MTKLPVKWKCFDSTVSLLLWSLLKLPLYDFSDLQISCVFWESPWHQTIFNKYFSRCHKPYRARPIFHASNKCSPAMMYNILISTFAIMHPKKQVVKITKLVSNIDGGEYTLKQNCIFLLFSGMFILRIDIFMCFTGEKVITSCAKITKAIQKIHKSMWCAYVILKV